MFRGGIAIYSVSNLDNRDWPPIRHSVEGRRTEQNPCHASTRRQQKVGGFEIAGIVGTVLAAASKRCAIVLDGVISTAAGLLAYMIHPDISGYLISGHKSVEKAQHAALEYMGLEPVIDFEMRLGEGTGAALTIDIVDAACRIMREMASFDEAGVSEKT